MRQFFLGWLLENEVARSPRARIVVWSQAEGGIMGYIPRDWDGTEIRLEVYRRVWLDGKPME